MHSKNINNLFLVLFSLIPLSIVIGPSAALANVLMIDLVFLILIFLKKLHSFIQNKAVKYLLLLYLYLIFNSLISVDQEVGLLRNLGFIRLIILFVAFNYFFKQKFFLKNVLLVWSIIITIILFDIFIESFTGQNLLGYGQDYGKRIVSFFKNEPIVGGFVNSFYLIIIGFLFTQLENQNKKFALIFSIIFLIGILLTGERSNGIKALIGFSIFYLSLKNYDIKKKIGLIISLFIFFLILIFNSQYLKMRFVDQIKAHISKDSKERIYFELYKSGFEVFKNHIFFGAGNKNYRVVTCEKNDLDAKKKENYFCNTHPHQIYLEMLSEHGIIGSFLIFFILYKLIFSKIRYVYVERNYIQIGSLIYILLTFLPLLPSGAFFSDYMITLFMINISIFYSSSKRLNIFNK